jgi:hypothetical protein
MTNRDRLKAAFMKEAKQYIEARMKKKYGEDFTIEWDKPSEGGNFAFRTGSVPRWNNSTQFMPTNSLGFPQSDSFIAAGLIDVSPEARMEFALLERAYYSYWISRLKCVYRGWNANIQSYSAQGCYGCTETQDSTYFCLNNSVHKLKYWKIDRIRIPAHHAVVVYLKGKNFKEGYLFDPWPTQSPLIYRFRDWPFSFKFIATIE